MSPENFRSIALSLPQALEGGHMGHADFRIAGKIFASLGAPDASFGMVKLTREEQELFIERAPEVFVPASGAWGLRGYTSVRLAAAAPDLVESALRAAWRNTAPKRLVTLPEV